MPESHEAKRARAVEEAAMWLEKLERTLRPTESAQLREWLKVRLHREVIVERCKLWQSSGSRSCTFPCSTNWPEAPLSNATQICFAHSGAPDGAGIRRLQPASTGRAVLLSSVSPRILRAAVAHVGLRSVAWPSEGCRRRRSCSGAGTWRNVASGRDAHRRQRSGDWKLRTIRQRTVS